MKIKTALICGISGQDGGYLAKYLLSKGYKVYGTSRDAQGSTFSNLRKLCIFERVELMSMVPEDFRSVLMVIKQCSPDEVYYLAGQSSVGLSFEQPAETIQSITMGTLNLLESCRMAEKKIRLYQAGSSECFGDTQGRPVDENTPFSPCSPYAVAKASAFWLVNNYRESYGLYACTGLLFNHESPLRAPRFVTQKIIQAVRRISKGSGEKLTLGRTDVSRDWGWAPEYVEAMWKMLQLDNPQDFVIATGKSFSLEAFMDHAFRLHGLSWRKYVIQDPMLFRPTDILISCANPEKAEKILGWQAKITMPEVVEKMIKYSYWCEK